MNLLDLILIILLLAWLTGNFAFHLGSLIHLILVVIVVVALIRFLQGRPVV